MSLIKCIECGFEVSKKADNCPNCGARISRHLVIKGASVIVTILTLVMTVISILIAWKSLDISEKSLNISSKSLDVSKQATDISNIALRISSTDTEPLFYLKIDKNNNKLSIQHETHEIYRIKYVKFGKVKTIAIMKSPSEEISGVEILQKYGEMPLIKGRSENVGGCSEEEAIKYNKQLEFSLDDFYFDNTRVINQMTKKVKKDCKNNKNIHYWGVSRDFAYYFIEVIYSDAQGNLDSAFYIYKKEYMTDWNMYKISKEDYFNYTKNIISYNGTKKEEKKIIDELFSDISFKKFEESKYDQMWEWINLRQFE